MTNSPIASAIPCCAEVLGLLAVKQAGRRAVVIGGWARLHEVGVELQEMSLQLDTERFPWMRDRVREASDFAGQRGKCFFVASAPHRWLFKRCCCVVHHGGAGTTQAALAAGKPCVITPIAWDQWEWVKVVERLGVGKGFQDHIWDITPSRLADAIVAALALAPAAELLGERMREEPGAAPAAEHLCRFLRRQVRTGQWRLRFDALRAPLSIG
mmetsp:Transcript_30752/g.71477  ORF Transcript_30752/g.71477 Transcript_30752/m.71477 type:complete len:213 (-) Transcript_30752:32-670(-)